MPYRGTAAASRIAALILFAMAGLIAPAQAKGLGPGQWAIEANFDVTQQICIVGDGTWYGTTFNWNGHWAYSTDKSRAVLFGNYAINNEPFGYGNDTITIYSAGYLVLSWEDWFDDESYLHFEGADRLEKVKAKCDKPNTGMNTQAASQ